MSNVHLTLAPPDGYDAWSSEEWDAWLKDHAWEPAEELVERGEWFVFLYMVRVHAKKTAGDLAPFLERLVTERGLRTGEIERVQEGFRVVRAELDTVPASRLWTGTQFYSHDELHAHILAAEGTTGRTGQALMVADLWRALFDSLDAVFTRARADQRGVYFGRA